MTDDKIVVSVSLPQDLIDEMDNMRDRIGYQKSRAEYVCNAMDVLFRIMVDNRLKIDAQVDALKSVQEIDPSTIVAITKAATKTYMEKYDKYEGKKKQITLRPAPKLVEDIEGYCTKIGLYDDLQQFIRIAISNQIELDAQLINKLDRIEEHRIFQKRNTDDIINSVLASLSNDGSESVNALVDIVNLFLKEAGKEKKDE